VAVGRRTMTKAQPAGGRRRLLLAAWVVILLTTAAALAQGADPASHLHRIRLPEGFAIQIYARVPGARSLAYAPDLALLFVGSRRDTVHVVMDRDGDGVGETVLPLAQGLRVPNGIAYGDGFLYVAENHRIVRFDLKDWTPGRLLEPEVVYDRLPRYDYHGWRYLALGPDGRLYVALGVPCNICTTEDPVGAIARLNRDGTGFEVYARGIRNSVGMDWHPATGELFFTDNGADMLGDDIPADELNHAPRPGLHFGFPYYAGGRTRSPQFPGPVPVARVSHPVVEFGAHTASLGIHFYRGAMFPAEYRHDAFVAQHGSWNRTEPIGYRVKRVRFNERGQPVGKEVFAEGWLLPDGTAWGRPVDVEELPDGSLLVSDDYAGLIYRITYAPGPGSSATNP